MLAAASGVMSVSQQICSLMLKSELHRAVPENAVLVGAYKYDKFFSPDEVPSYGLIAHQRHSAYSQCFEEYRHVLGNITSLISTLYAQGYVPMVFFPDVRYPDSFTVLNPYEDMDYEVVNVIDMEEKAGIFGRFIPEDKRKITIARLLEKEPGKEPAAPDSFGTREK